MIDVCRRIQFCAGHRVLGHEGKCKNLHGHNYVAHIWATRVTKDELDNVGRVFDFGDLKDKVGGWIEANWDHKFLLWKEDSKLMGTLVNIDQPFFALPYNPTAENIGRYLIEEVCPAVLPPFIKVFRVDVQETENCGASITNEGV